MTVVDRPLHVDVDESNEDETNPRRRRRKCIIDRTITMLETRDVRSGHSEDVAADEKDGSRTRENAEQGRSAHEMKNRDEAQKVWTVELCAQPTKPRKHVSKQQYITGEMASNKCCRRRLLKQFMNQGC